MTPATHDSPHRHVLHPRHKKYQRLGIVTPQGKIKEGGYLVSYERHGIFIVAIVGPYQVVWFTVPGAWRRLSRRFENSPEVRNETFRHDESVQNEEI
jgi:hypothetical protein